jgi:hypothetical protein
MDRLIQAWIDELESGQAQAPEAPGEPRRTEPPQEPRGEEPPLLEEDGLLMRFRDERGGLVALSPRGGLLLHRGTLGFEAGLARVGGWPGECNLSGAEASALAFALRWWGAPFDAVGVGSSSPGVTWGIGRFTGAELARTLFAFEQKAPEAFEALLGRFGVRVTGSPEAVELQVGGTGGRAVAHGARAIVLLAEEPRLVAVLARAGRDVEAGRVQLQAVARRALGPLRTLLAERSAPAEGDKAPPMPRLRTLAALYTLSLALGPRAVARLGPALLAAEDAQQEDGSLHALARQLGERGHPAEALQVLRVLASPELDA